MDNEFLLNTLNARYGKKLTLLNLFQTLMLATSDECYGLFDRYCSKCTQYSDKDQLDLEISECDSKFRCALHRCDCQVCHKARTDEQIGALEEKLKTVLAEANRYVQAITILNCSHPGCNSFTICDKGKQFRLCTFCAETYCEKHLYKYTKDHCEKMRICLKCCGNKYQSCCDKYPVNPVIYPLVYSPPEDHQRKYANSNVYLSGVTLLFDTYDTNNTPIWELNLSEQQKHGTGQNLWKRKATSQGDIVTLNPKESIEDFISLINLVFVFTATHKSIFPLLPPEAIITLLEKNKLIERLHNVPLEHKVKFVRIDRTCVCDMGYCGAITGVTVDDRDFKTYGDVMKLFSCGGSSEAIFEWDEDLYYKYPNSVWLRLQLLKELPETVPPAGSYCGNYRKVSFDVKLDPNTTYIQWEYNR